MIIECKSIDDEQVIENYIGKNYYKCLYLYLDLKKYKFSNPNVKIWIQKNDNNITSIILMYYSGMHVFSKNHDYDIEELKKLIEDRNPTMICGEKKTICDIYNILNVRNYYIETGWVRKLLNIKNVSRDNVELAKEEDFYQIAKLLYEDEDLGCSYKLEELKDQMIERNKEGYVRNYIIKDKNTKNVISHAGTGAENDKIAMLSYVITDINYRGKGYAQKLCSAVCEDLIKEGKEVFLINYSTESTALYEKIGFKICCEWGKIFLNLKDN